MVESITLRSTADRLNVFVSSTIGECAAERAAARRAILSLNFDPVLFEREGARAEAPRDFYRRKLQDAHIVIGIYRSDYGWIDTAKGMTISGLEDEFRDARELEKDLLAYVLKSAPNRDARLATIVEELKGSAHVIYFFDEGEDLEQRIRDDLTALVTDHVTRAQALSPAIDAASSVLEAIFRDSALRIRRTGPLEQLTSAAATSRVIWLAGSAGAGKTALAAEWAVERGAAYVNARGLDPREVLLAAAEAIGVLNGAERATPLFDDVRALLLSRWRNGMNWPLVLDDPDDASAVWAIIKECLAGSSSGSVVLIAREPPVGIPGQRVEITGFSQQELDALQAIAGVAPSAARAGDLPVVLRRVDAADGPAADIDRLPAHLREALGYLALSPTPLSLEDVLILLGSSISSATELAEQLDGLAGLLMASPAGYVFVHDLLREAVATRMGARVQLRGFLLDRLSQRLAFTGRAWAAFALLRSERSEATAKLANRAMHEAVFNGSTRHLVTALEFLADYYRDRGERGRLSAVLLSLAEARVNEGRPAEAPALLDEALHLVEEIGDADAVRTIDIFRAALDLRRSASQAALDRVRSLRKAALDEERFNDAGRLMIDEGIAFLSVNENSTAIPLFREALRLFEETEDSYGIDVATRNLVVSLANSPDGHAEAERLRAMLDETEGNSPRYRAWLCNLRVPSLRRERRFDEAEELAREAIAIALSLGDQYLESINLVALGNVLREAGRQDEAIDAYARSGELAQRVGRPDIEGRSSRLLALTENTAAEQAEGVERHAHASRAEQYATHAAGLLSQSYAWGERAYAIEERGDARRLQGRGRAAMLDYASAVDGYIKADDLAEAERLLRYFLPFISDQDDVASLIAQAFNSSFKQSSAGPSETWVHALSATLEHCPHGVAPAALGTLIRAFLPANRDEWWLHCLVRCLLTADLSGLRSRPAMGSLLLLAILGFSPYRQLRPQDLLNLAGLCIGPADTIAIRHHQNSDLELVVWLGNNRQVLFTIRTEAQTSESIFVALLIGCFLDAFGEALAELLSVEALPDGACLDVTIFSQAAESEVLAAFFANALKNRSVVTARITPDEGENAPIVIVVRHDAISELEATPLRGGDLEVTLALFLEEVVHAISGGSLDDAIFYSKVRDLLMSVLR